MGGVFAQGAQNGMSAKGVLGWCHVLRPVNHRVEWQPNAQETRAEAWVFARPATRTNTSWPFGV